jgi:hypothetical protein
VQKICKFGDRNQSKSGVNLKEIESLMVDMGQIEQIRNQGPMKKNAQVREVKSRFLGVRLQKIKSFKVN